MGKGRRVRASRRHGDRGAVAGEALNVAVAVAAPLPRYVGAHVNDRPGDYLEVPATRHPDRYTRVAVGLAALGSLQERRAVAREAMAAVEGEIADAVRQLRFDGASWTQIGERLGLTRQGARQHFDKRSGPHRSRTSGPGSDESHA